MTQTFAMPCDMLRCQSLVNVKAFDCTCYGVRGAASSIHMIGISAIHLDDDDDGDNDDDLESYG